MRQFDYSELAAKLWDSEIVSLVAKIHECKGRQDLYILCIHPFNDGNGRMSRLLTLLLMYRSGYQVGKYVSIEKEIEKSKEQYYDAIALADENWHEGTNDPTPFIRYMLRVILAGYIDFEDRVRMMEDVGIKSSPYDIVKAYASGKLGHFSGAEVVAGCPTISRSSALAAVKQLVEEGFLLRLGNGKNTKYVRQTEEE